MSGDVLAEVADERGRQDEKWGEQNHPDVSAIVIGHPESVPDVHGVPSATDAKLMTESRAAAGLVSWADIAIEKLAEALEAAAECDEDAARTEVVQLTAVCVQWVQAIDRRRQRLQDAGELMEREGIEAAEALARVDRARSAR